MPAPIGSAYCEPVFTGAHVGNAVRSGTDVARHVACQPGEGLSPLRGWHEICPKGPHRLAKLQSKKATSLEAAFFSTGLLSLAGLGVTHR